MTLTLTPSVPQSVTVGRGEQAGRGEAVAWGFTADPIPWNQTINHIQFSLVWHTLFPGTGIPKPRNSGLPVETVDSWVYNWSNRVSKTELPVQRLDSESSLKSPETGPLAWLFDVFLYNWRDKVHTVMSSFPVSGKLLLMLDADPWTVIIQYLHCTVQLTPVTVT